MSLPSDAHIVKVFSVLTFQKIDLFKCVLLFHVGWPVKSNIVRLLETALCLIQLRAIDDVQRMFAG